MTRDLRRSDVPLHVRYAIQCTTYTRICMQHHDFPFSGRSHDVTREAFAQSDFASLARVHDRFVVTHLPCSRREPLVLAYLTGSVAGGRTYNRAGGRVAPARRSRIAVSGRAEGFAHQSIPGWTARRVCTSARRSVGAARGMRRLAAARTSVLLLPGCTCLRRSRGLLATRGHHSHALAESGFGMRRDHLTLRKSGPRIRASQVSI